MPEQVGLVYLVHFDPPLVRGRHGNPHDTVSHYLGWTKGEVTSRLRLHMSGRGSRLLKAAAEQGCTITLVRTWTGTRKLERTLKNRRNAPHLCHICTGEAAATRGCYPHLEHPSRDGYLL